MDSSDTKNIIVSPKPFLAPKVMAVGHGLSIKMIVDAMYDFQRVPEVMRYYDVEIELNGEVIERSRWNIIPNVADHILINVPIHGGGGGGGKKNPLRTILSLIVVVVAAVATWYAGGAGGWGTAGALGLKGASAALYASAVGAAVSAAGSLLVNALFPLKPAGISGGGDEASPTYSLQGSQNPFIPWGTIPAVLGTYRHYPPLGARPYTEILGNDEYLRLLFVWGYGPLDIDEDTLKIGDTPITDYVGVEMEHREGREDDEAITLFPENVHQEQIGVEAKVATGRIIRSAQPYVDELSVDILFPAGCYSQSDNGPKRATAIDIKLEYREKGTELWTAVTEKRKLYYENTPIVFDDDYRRQGVEYGIYIVYQAGAGLNIVYVGDLPQLWDGTQILLCTVTWNGGADYTVTPPSEELCPNFGYYKLSGIFYILSSYIVGDVNVFYIYDRTTSPTRKGYRWAVDNTKEYEVAITRITRDAELSGPPTLATTSYFSVLRSFINSNPVTFPKPLAMTAMRIKATDQLQGVVNTFNGMVSSLGMTWNGAEWAGEEVVQNPAELAVLVLQHNALARPRSDEQIDFDCFGEWFDFCEDHGFQFNMIRDFKASLWDTLSDICMAGRAAPSLIDGKWGVIWDTEDKEVSQHITPRNSWGFTAEKVLFTPPHAFRVAFKNEENYYIQDERIVYDDGYTVDNATDFESIELLGITHPDLIWKTARYHMAQARLRPEVFTWSMDFEHLVFRRGHKVRVSHDVPLWGGGWSRVKELVMDGDNVTGVVLDDEITMVAGKDYACRFRLADAANTSLVLSVVNPGSAVTNTFDFTVEGGIPSAEAPQVGDLAMFGESNLETVELLVKNIERSGDFTARITAVDLAADIYDADTGDIPLYNPHISEPPDITTLPPTTPIILRIDAGTSALEIFNNAIRTRVIIYLTPGGGNVLVKNYRVRYRHEDSEIWIYVSGADGATKIQLTEVDDDETYYIQAQAISIYGTQSPWTAITETLVLGQEEDPSDVTGFTCHIVGETAYLSWNAVTDLDLSHYRLKWTDDQIDPSWDSAADLILNIPRSSNNVAVAALVGSYLIKTVDLRGNESVNAAAVVTNITSIANLNVVESFEQPDEVNGWEGESNGFVNGDGFRVGVFSAIITDLESETNYRVRAYIIDSEGNIFYGDTVNLLTGAES